MKRTAGQRLSTCGKDFRLRREGVDEDTGETEYEMGWRAAAAAR